MHFAAQSHVDNSFGNSLTFTRTNTLGTHTLLECARLTQAQLKLFIYVSTDEVYGENTPTSGAFHEQYVLSPQNPYAASKAAGEMFAQSYYHSFKLPVIITRGKEGCFLLFFFVVCFSHAFRKETTPLVLINILRSSFQSLLI